MDTDSLIESCEAVLVIEVPGLKKSMSSSFESCIVSSGFLELWNLFNSFTLT